MFRPSIQKLSTLILLALFNVSMVFIARNSFQIIKKQGYDEKIKAVELMRDAIKKIENNFSEDLLGLESSGITTSVLDSMNQKRQLAKEISLHPNYAAMVVDMLYTFSNFDQNFKDQKLAISMTGSYPGLNLAVLSACKALEINPVIISSLGASSWGANRENMHWGLIEDFLLQSKIFPFKSSAYSIGGDFDVGYELNSIDRKKLIEYLESNFESDQIINYKYFNTLKTNKKLSKSKLNNMLASSINERKQKFGDLASYDLYINIGGGAASLGQHAYRDSLDVGALDLLLVQGLLEDYYLDENFNTSSSGLIYDFIDYSVNIINLRKIKMMCLNDYPDMFNNNQSIFKGSAFTYIKDYHPIIISICLAASICSIIAISIISHYQIKRRMLEDIK